MNHVFPLLLLLFSCSGFVFAADPPKKLAVVGDPFLSGLVTAELSRDGNFELMERAAVEKILREHALSGNALAFSRLASAFSHIDLFAVLEKNKIVVFNAKNGFRLADRTFPPDENPPLKTICEEIRRSSDKLTAVDPVFLAIVSVRDVGVPLRLKPKITETTVLFEQALIRCPKIQMLERARLYAVLDERRQTGRQFPLTPSGRLLSLEFEPGGEEGVVDLTVILEDLSGSRIGELKEPDVFSGKDAGKTAAEKLVKRFFQEDRLRQ